MKKLLKTTNKRKKKKRDLYKSKKLKLIEIDGKDITGSTILNAYSKVAQIFLRNNIIRKVPKINSFKAINFLIFRLYDLKVFEKQLKNVQKEFGFIPSYGKLYKSGYSSLASQMMKLGGFPLIRKKFNLKSKPN